MASATACVLVLARSLARTCSRCVLTVVRPMPSASAACWMVRPRDSSSRIRSCAFVGARSPSEPPRYCGPSRLTPSSTAASLAGIGSRFARATAPSRTACREHTPDSPAPLLDARQRFRFRPTQPSRRASRIGSDSSYHRPIPTAGRTHPAQRATNAAAKGSEPGPCPHPQPEARREYKRHAEPR